MSWTEEEDKKNQQNLTNQQGELFEEDNAGQNRNSDKESDNSKSSETKLDDNQQLWRLLEKTLSDNVIEKRRARRWKIFFRFTSLIILLCIMGLWFGRSALDTNVTGQNTVAIIPMDGVIGSGADIDGNEYVDILDDVYKNPNLKGVVIDMNSPGGSPVQAGIIYDAIRQKEKLYPSIPIIVVVEDMAASGGYYIASAANKIYANRASLVGSIGVISSGFDLSGLIKKFGVERRTFTAGRNKDFLDPFVPMTKEGKEKWQAILDETHQQFIDAVKAGRGDRLKITNDVFSGMVFTGQQAQKIGLIDGLASLNDVLNSQFPNDKQVIYGPKQDPLDEFAKKFGVEFAAKLLSNAKLN